MQTEKTVIASANELVEQAAPEEVIEQAVDMVDQVSEYGFLIMDSLYLLIIGMVIIFILHRFSSAVLPRKIKKSRLVNVLFGALYVLVLTITILLALREIGFEVRVIAQISLISILIGAVVIFFLVPFLPRLPFILGHMVEINGVMGTVDAISTFHTTIRKFDGTMVFIPNALVMASRIMNFHDTPERRIELKFGVHPDSDLAYAKDQIAKLIGQDERVLDDPSPPVVFVMSATASSVDMVGYCWVVNADWLSARSDLWLKAMTALRDDAQIKLAIPEQKVYFEEPVEGIK